MYKCYVQNGTFHKKELYLFLFLYILITFQLLIETTANNKTISSLKHDLMIFLSSGKNLFPLHFEIFTITLFFSPRVTVVTGEKAEVPNVVSIRACTM